MKLDGRRARWFDCDWNNDSGILKACEQCRICKYLDFIDYAENVGKPEGSVIHRNALYENYLDLNTLEERQKYLVQVLEEVE